MDNQFFINNGNLGSKPGISNDMIAGCSISNSGSVELAYSTINLLELLIAGKDIVEHRKEYLDHILRLPFVDGNHLKAIEVFHRMRKLQEFLEKE